MKVKSVTEYQALLDKDGCESRAKRDQLGDYTDWYLFDGISLRGKDRLEIGSGYGLYSFYAACKGAKNVVGLEPESDGATAGIQEVFRRLQTLTGAKDSVALKPVTFQDYDSEGRLFDVILLHNSINHLDERACMRLRRDAAARDTYISLFAKLRALSQDGARLIVADCSRRNFFGALHVRNPFSPSIEWHKHETPWFWADLLRRAGFEQPRVRWKCWPAYRHLGGIGRQLFANAVASYFQDSHFCLTMRAASHAG